MTRHLLNCENVTFDSNGGGGATCFELMGFVPPSWPVLDSPLMLPASDEAAEEAADAAAMEEVMVANIFAMDSACRTSASSAAWRCRSSSLRKYSLLSCMIWTNILSEDDMGGASSLSTIFFGGMAELQ